MQYTRFKVAFDVGLFKRRETDPAAEILEQSSGKHEVSNAEFLVYRFGYLTTLR